VLETARPLAPYRLVTVFGCGGERDRTKRPLMGAVAARLSDRIVITSDNPRGEDPLAIIEDIKRGLGSQACLTIPDRRSAIEEVIRTAEPGDTILIAGKGHERYQVIGASRQPFDDREVAQAALARRRGAAAAAGAASRQAG
jgi:UDP-N-acetylmuramoyl-L-alanyl-D-glutamate--2,6-diaminopimelate ligase